MSGVAALQAAEDQAFGLAVGLGDRGGVGLAEGREAARAHGQDGFAGTRGEVEGKGKQGFVVHAPS